MFPPCIFESQSILMAD